PDLLRLLEVRDGFAIVIQLGVDRPNIVERLRFLLAIAQRAIQRQRLLIISESLLIIVQPAIGEPQAVERIGLAVAIVCREPELARFEQVIYPSLNVANGDQRASRQVLYYRSFPNPPRSAKMHNALIIAFKGFRDFVLPLPGLAKAIKRAPLTIAVFQFPP